MYQNTVVFLHLVKSQNALLLKQLDLSKCSQDELKAGLISAMQAQSKSVFEVLLKRVSQETLQNTEDFIKVAILISDTHKNSFFLSKLVKCTRKIDLSMRQLMQSQAWTVKLLKQHEFINEEQLIQYAVETRNVPLFPAKMRGRSLVTLTHPIICTYFDHVALIIILFAFLLAIVSIYEWHLLGWTISASILAIVGISSDIKHVSCSCNGLSSH
jgi:hypothetical protein